MMADPFLVDPTTLAPPTPSNPAPPSTGDVSTDNSNPFLQSNPITDTLLKAQRLAESNDNPKTKPGVAPDGTEAYGAAQFQLATGKKYGINSRADAENPDIANPAQRALMTDNYNKYGSVDLALAAYNMAPSRVDALVKKYQDPDEVVKHLPQGVQTYIAKIKNTDLNLQNQAQGASTTTQATPLPTPTSSAPPTQPTIAPQPAQNPYNPFLMPLPESDPVAAAKNLEGGLSAFASGTAGMAFPGAESMASAEQAMNPINSTPQDQTQAQTDFPQFNKPTDITNAAAQGTQAIQSGLDTVLPGSSSPDYKQGGQELNAAMSAPFELADKGLTKLGVGPEGQALFNYVAPIAMGTVVHYGAKGVGLLKEAANEKLVDAGILKAKPTPTTPIKPEDIDALVNDTINTKADSPSAKPLDPEVDSSLEDQNLPPETKAEAPESPPVVVPEAKPTDVPGDKTSSGSPVAGGIDEATIRRVANDILASTKPEEGPPVVNVENSIPTDAQRAAVPSEAAPEAPAPESPTVESVSNLASEDWLENFVSKLNNRLYGKSGQRLMNKQAGVLGVPKPVPKQYEYPPRFPGDPEVEVNAKRLIVDAMNGKLSVDDLVDSLRKTGLPNGTLTAITERLGDRMSVEQQRRMLMNKQAGSAPIFKDFAEALLNLAKTGYKIGDNVRLMSGEIGRIQDMKPDETGKQTYTVKTDAGDTRSLTESQLDYRYKPSGIVTNPVGYNRPISSVGGLNRQRGAINLPSRETVLEKIGAFQGSPLGRTAAYLRDRLSAGRIKPEITPIFAKPSDIPYTKDQQLERMYSLYTKARDVADFKDSLAVEARSNLGFPVKNVKNAQDWWNAFDNGYKPEAIPEYLKMDDATRREGNADLPFSEFQKTLPDPDEITSRDDMGTQTENLLPTNIAEYNVWNRAGTKVFKWATDTTRDIISMANKKAAMLMAYKQAYLDLPRKSMLNVLGHFRDWDLYGKYHQELVDSKLWYPTKEMLINHGATEGEANAYTSMATAYKLAFQLLDRTAERLPGYMPHMWHGQYAVDLIDTTHNKPMYTVHAPTRWQAIHYAEGLTKAGYQISEIRSPSISTKFSQADSLLQAMQMFKTDKYLDPQIRSRIQTRLDNLQKGVLYEDKERHGVVGYLGYEGVKPENFTYQGMLNRGFNNQFGKVFDQYMHDVVRAWRAERVVRAVVKPLSDVDYMTEKLPATLKNIKDMVSKATGFSSSEVTGIETAMNQVLSRMGLPTNILKNVVLAANSAARFRVINSANVGFASQHILFSLFGVTNLIKAHVDLQVAGAKTGDFGTALANYAKSLGPDGITPLDPELKAGLDWYKGNGLKTNMYQGETPTGHAAVDMIKHGLLNLMVNKGRKMTFVLGYSYYKDIMPKPQALVAARQFADRTMQSFAPMDSPGIFNEGAAGAVLRPFQQIKTYTLGRVLGSLESVTNAAKTNPSKIPLALSVPLSYAAMSMALGGIYGIPFEEDWNKLSSWANRNLGYSLPTSEQIALKTLPSWSILGPVSTLLRTNVGPTFEGFNFSTMFGGTALGLGSDLIELLAHEGEKYISGSTEYNSERAAMEGLTFTQHATYMKKEDAEKTSGVEANRYGEPTIRPLPSDYIHDILLGKQTTGEAMARMSSEANNMANVQQKNYQAKISKIIFENLIGNNTGPDQAADIMRKAVQSGDYNPQTLPDYLTKEAQRRNMPYAANYVIQMMNEKDPMEQLRMVKNFRTYFKNSDSRVGIGQ